MLDQIMNLVRENAGNAIVNNPAIPNERNEEAIEHTSQGIFDSLKSQANGGGIQGLMSMFQGGGNAGAGPVAGLVQNDTVAKLMAQFGLNQTQASGIVGQIVPGVMSKLVSKTNDPNDSSLDFQSIISSLTGGGGGLGGFNLGNLGNIGGMFS